MSLFVRLTFSIFVVGIIAIWAANFWRESRLLHISGLNLSRLEVTLKEKEAQSINFGADEKSTFLFELPEDFDGLAHCNAGGYSSIRTLEIIEFHMDEALSCTREEMSTDGALYVFVVFSRYLYIKVLA